MPSNRCCSSREGPVTLPPPVTPPWDILHTLGKEDGNLRLTEEFCRAMAPSYNTFWPVSSLQLIFVAGPPGLGYWSRSLIRKQLGDGRYLVEQIVEGGWRNGVVEEKAIWDIVSPDPSLVLSQDLR